ncbi:general substrate transporter [Pseudohyphozyma bogoriensis]|nr:general substrate transporter [Pseudohyphozyma bogoriensis]
MYQLRGRYATIGITIASGFGWILFGYDLGVLGGVLTLPAFTKVFPMSSTYQGLVSAIFDLGATLGAIFMAFFGNKLGRRDNINLGTFTIAASSNGVGQLIAGRVIGGIGLGMFSTMCPLWQGESARPAIRGRVVAFSLSFLIVGLLIAYWLDYGMAQHTTGQIAWRFPFAFQAILASINIVLTRFLPESPRWLRINKREDDAIKALAALRDTAVDDPATLAEMDEIALAIELENKHAGSIWDLFKKDDEVRSRRRLLTCLALQTFQPFSGSTPISFYVTPILQDSVGLSADLASLMSGYLQIWFLVASMATWWLIEHAGRRRMHLVSTFLMGGTMASLAGCIKLGGHAAGIGAAFLIFLYQALFTWGMMSGVWAYSSEIHSTKFRTLGTALGAVMQWLWSFVVVQIVPVSISNIGWKTFMLFAAFNWGFFPIVYFWFPETAGIPLESIDLLFRPGVDPVKESRRIRAAIRAGKMDEVTLAHNEDRNDKLDALARTPSGPKLGSKTESEMVEQV